MHIIFLSIVVLGAAIGPASAQQSPFDCGNDPVRVDIPSLPLDRALARLSNVTHCPISGIDKARGRRSKAVHGTLAPELALRAMVRGTGLDGESIKQGLTVYRRR